MLTQNINFKGVCIFSLNDIRQSFTAMNCEFAKGPSVHLVPIDTRDWIDALSLYWLNILSINIVMRNGTQKLELAGQEKGSTPHLKKLWH
jgi:hypothetical protein